MLFSINVGWPTLNIEYYICMIKITKIDDKKIEEREQESHFTSCHTMNFLVISVPLDKYYVCVHININISVYSVYTYREYFIGFTKTNKKYKFNDKAVHYLTFPWRQRCYFKILSHGLIIIKWSYGTVDVRKWLLMQNFGQWILNSWKQAILGMLQIHQPLC